MRPYAFNVGYSNGNVRLIGGTTVQQGRVEIWYSNQWNTVCDDSWDINDATVVCRQLGYRGAVTAHQSAHFGQGSGQILLDDLHCTGSEASLLECSHAGINVHNCGHGEDASVTCEFDFCLDACYYPQYNMILLVYIHTLHSMQVLHQGFLAPTYVSPMVTGPQKVELRYGILTSGIQCVMIPGTLLMQLLCAGNLGTKEQLPITVLTLAKDQEESYWMIWTALVLRHLYSSVHMMGSTATTVAIVKMQVCHVSENCT